MVPIFLQRANTASTDWQVAVMGSISREVHGCEFVLNFFLPANPTQVQVPGKTFTEFDLCKNLPVSGIIVRVSSVSMSINYDNSCLKGHFDLNFLDMKHLDHLNNKIPSKNSSNILNPLIKSPRL